MIQQKRLFKLQCITHMRTQDSIIVEYPFSQDWQEFFTECARGYGYKLIVINLVARDFEHAYCVRAARDRQSDRSEVLLCDVWIPDNICHHANHENFDRLAQYPEIEWNGGRVHQVRPSVLHLERGYVFNLEGQKVFTFGGAESKDVEGGILDPADPEYTNKLHEVISDYAPFRVKGVSWWEQELPTDEEMQRGLENLRNVDGQVDLIITHCASSSTQAVISQRKPNKLTDYFEQIKREVHYKDWYFGHYHQTRDLRAGEHAIYSEIRRWK